MLVTVQSVTPALPQKEAWPYSGLFIVYPLVFNPEKKGLCLVTFPG
jgi:hypothetical protein